MSMFQARPLDGHEDVTFMRTAASLLGRPLMWSGFLCVDDCFIDCGNARSDRRAMADHLRRSGLAARASRLLLTHMHEDHCGNVDLLRREAGVQVLAPGHVTRRDFSDLGLLYRVYWGIPAMVTADGRVPERLTTDAGRTIVAIPTPGHAPCHMAYRVEPDELLFTGDAVPLPSNKLSTMHTEDYPGILRTLRAVRELVRPGTTVVTAHGGPLADPAQYIDRRIANMQRVVDQVLEAHAAGRSAGQVEREVLGRNGLTDWLAAPRISRARTVESILASLNKSPPRSV